METVDDNNVSSDPALIPFVTATAAEIAYAEELLRQIERRYLNQPAEPRTMRGPSESRAIAGTAAD